MHWLSACIGTFNLLDGAGHGLVGRLAKARVKQSDNHVCIVHQL